MDAILSTPFLVLLGGLNVALTAALWLWTRATARRRPAGPWKRLWLPFASVVVSGVITGVLITRIDIF